VKGIDALIINEDTTKTADLWKRARTSAAMVYMSPEMALSPSFQKLWKDSRFRTRLTAIVVDEAHCIAEWGGEDFRPAYRLLETLQSYTGHEVPVVACTATCTTKTFDLIWTTLGYGHRPFWGLDVGSDRPNLLYITRILENPKNPLLDILNLLPNDLAADSPLDAIPKCIFYFNSEDACRKAVQFICKCLPEHLRKSVQAFSSNMSELAKEQCWELFSKGEFRIICATDAAGMGCNVSDVKYIVTFGLTKSLGTISQRWGRAGRDRATEGVCLWLVPKWAFRPQQPSTTNPIVQQLQSSKNNRPLEMKHETV
jgi:superfamily II DNA helicase RecQ